MTDPMTDAFATMFSNLAGLFGLGLHSDPPESVPLRILGLDAVSCRADVVAAFRRKVLTCHPDLGAYSLVPGANETVEAVAWNDMTVQELVWARDLLLRMHPEPVTTEKGHTVLPPFSRNEVEYAEPEWRRHRQARVQELIPQVEERRARAREGGYQHRWLESVEQAAAKLLEDLAREDCRWCSTCGRGIAAAAPVWRQRNWRGRVQVVCEGCRDEYQFFGWSAPCARCGRTVHQKNWQQRTVCSESCRLALDRERARLERAESRVGKRCAECDEPFDADRADRRYCSNACRQRAYRGKRGERAAL
jgi:hypothetical protein